MLALSSSLHAQAVRTVCVVLPLLLLLACEKPASRAPSAPPPPSRLNTAQATELAQHLANQQARIFYRGEPFANGPPALWTNQHWFWRTRKGFGAGDLEATVSLAPDGSTQSVEVLFLDSRPNLPRF